MRFDLELNKVSTVRYSDLKYLSDVLYNIEDDTIIPAVYDNKTLFTNALVNRGSINTKRFNNFNNIPPGLFPSYVIDDGLDVYDILKYNSLSYILLNSGSFYSANKNFIWSNLCPKIKAEYGSSGYTAKLVGTPSIPSINVYTLGLKYPTCITKVKTYEYVKYTNSLEETFKKASKDFLFTVIDDTVHLNNSMIDYDDTFIGKGDGTTKIFVLPEFPAEHIEVHGYDEDEYTVTNGIIKFNSAPSNGEDVVVSYMVTPIVSYRNSSERDDIVYLPYNINPTTIGLKNGIVCAFNSYSNLNIPNKISIKSEAISSARNTYKITSTLNNDSGIPVTNKKITFKVLSEGALIGATNSTQYEATTSMNGGATAIVFGDYNGVGMYVQKEWVNGNTLSIPADVNIDNIGDAFLYIITGDDPILGSISASGSETPITEYYKNDNITSYYISGRKIAYLDIVDTGSEIITKYIKPVSIEKNTNQNIPFRNLNVNGTDGTIMRTRFGQTRYNDTATVLTFSDPIPSASTNIVGYYIAFNKTVDVNVTYQDEYVKLVSDTIKLEIKNIKSESPFTISKEAMPFRNTSLDDLGYFTVSDYITNTYGLYPLSYGCIHSDTIEKKCIHANKAYHLFYSLDSKGIFCSHLPETESSLPEEARCPGLYATLINPFSTGYTTPTITY